MVVSPKEVPDRMRSVNESLSSLETVIVVVVLPLLTDITSQEPVTSVALFIARIAVVATGKECED